MRWRSPARAAPRALAAALLALGCTSLSGCASGKAVEPAGEGFQRVSMPMPDRVFVFELDLSAGEKRPEAKQLADAVVTGLAAVPIPAVHVRPDTPLVGPALGVGGSFLSLETGVVDHLRADVQLQTLVDGFFETVHRFETEAAGEGRVERTAKEIVREVARFYASQGWLDPSRVPE